MIGKLLSQSTCFQFDGVHCKICQSNKIWLIWVSEHHIWLYSVILLTNGQPTIAVEKKIVQLFGHSARSMCALVRQKSPYKWSTIQISWEEREKSQPKPTVRSLCTFHVCGTLHCVPWCVKKVLGVRQYVHTFGPPGVFYNVLLPASINAVQSVHFIYLLSLSIS